MISNTGKLLDCERVVRSDDEFLHVELDSPLSLAGIIGDDYAGENRSQHSENGRGRAKFYWGDTGRASTRASLDTLSAPAAYRQEYERQRDTWEARTRAFSSALPSRKRRNLRDVEGDELDVSAWVAREEKCWQRQIRGRARPVVRIGVHASASHKNRETDFAEVVGMAVSAIRALSLAGYSTHVQYVWATYDARTLDDAGGKAKWVAWTMEAKQPREQVDVSALLSYGMGGIFRYGIMRRRWSDYAAIVGSMGTMRKPDAALSGQVGVDLWFGRSWPDGWKSGGTGAGNQIGEIMADLDRREGY